MAAEVVAPGNQEPHSKAEQSVPPDDSEAKQRTVPKQIRHQDTGAERACGNHRRDAAVVGPLEHTEQREIAVQEDVESNKKRRIPRL